MLVPPNGWQQETAFQASNVDGARQAASDAATAKLRDRLCGQEGGCDFLQSRIRNWKMGSSATEVCAMAVIAREDLDEWRRVATSLRTLDDGLAAAAKDLLGAKAGHRVVAVDRIRDMGVPGGTRAEWLKARMERQLQKYAVVSSAPKGWAGDTVPSGIDVIVSAIVTERNEDQIPIVETDWVSITRGGGKLQAGAITFPQIAAPPFVGASVDTPQDSAGLSLRMDSQRAGSLCFGERTQVWLKSDATMNVRVINLYGDSDALLLFPNDEQPSGIVEKGKTVPMGGKLGFEAVPVPGSDLERFLVIGAPGKEGLGVFKSAQGTCRIPKDLARQLHHGAGLPAGIKQAWTGYRLVSGPGCSEPEDRRRQGVVEALASVPECKLR